MEKKSRVHIFVSGRVQGVFFRGNIYKEAKRLGIFGWVQNLLDGRVEVLLEGEKEKLEKMINWAKKGPIFAKINNFEFEWQDYEGEFKDFKVK